MLGSELSADSLTHTDRAVTAGTTYQYRLQARVSGGLRGAHGRGQRGGHGAAGGAGGSPAYFAVTQVACHHGAAVLGPGGRCATGYEVEIRQAFYADDHAEARVRLPLAGPVTLRTGADRTVEVTVLRTGTLVELRGLPASYSYWDLYVRATNAGGHSGWAETYVSSAAADSGSPPAHRGCAANAGRRAQRPCTGTPWPEPATTGSFSTSRRTTRGAPPVGTGCPTGAWR